MFDSIRNNKRIVQVFLVLITIPFALFGVEHYVQNFATDKFVAKVGKSEISAEEFQQSMRDQQQRMREQMGEAYDPEIVNRPEFRKTTVDGLINQRLLQQVVNKARMQATGDALRKMILEIPAFQENGKFSMKRYEELLAARGMNSASFEATLARDVAQQQFIAGISQSAIVPSASIERLLALQDEVRELAVWSIPLDVFRAKVKLADDAARKSYDSDLKPWETPEQVKLEYLVLSQQALAQQVVIAEEAVRKQYESKKERYASPEQRQARHILLEAPKDAAASKREAAKAKAESLLVQVKKTPASFANLAKANSQDIGSAPKGGDLGFFGRGDMVKPFEEAAFGLKVGEISGVVESDFGFHIIKLEAVRGGTVKPFDEVKTQIAEELKQEEAAKRFAEQAADFTNIVYEQSDTLQPAASKFKLSLAQSPLIARGARGLPPPFDNPRLLEAVFASDVVKNKRNTEAIDLGNNTLVSARVVEYQAAAVRPFETVRPQIEQALFNKEALKLAQTEGEQYLAALRKGQMPSEAKWGEPLKTSRGQAIGGLSPELMKAAFREPADKLPAYAGAVVDGLGYTLARISAVTKAEVKPEDPRRKMLEQQYARLLNDEDLRSYLKALRERYPVKINEAMVEQK